MNDANSNTPMHKAMFLQLVTMLAMSAMQQMGKIINPMTGKTDVNLEAAQSTIDLLDMLEAKTRGNLDKEEEKTLKDALSSLKMTYVETAKKTPPAEKAKEKPKQGKPSAGGPDTAPDITPGKPEDKKEKPPPKFHKAYE